VNILVGAAELAPFAKAGGLADVVAALARQWAAMGHRVLVVLPKYA
jgi:starch synthase